MQWWRSRRFWLFVAAGVLIAWLASQLPLIAWFTLVKDWLASLGAWAMPTFILLYLIATLLGLPNILLILIAGTLFGLIEGIISVSIADTLGAMACYVVGRTIARERIKKWIHKNPNFAQLDRAVGKKGWKILLLTRLSPLVPSNVLNYGFSCTKVNFWHYCFFSWLGMLPVIALYVYLGSFGISLLQEGFTPEKLALQSVGFVFAVMAGFYTTRIVRKALSFECSTDTSAQESS